MDMMDPGNIFIWLLMLLTTLGLCWALASVFWLNQEEAAEQKEEENDNSKPEGNGNRKSKSTTAVDKAKNKGKQRNRNTSSTSDIEAAHPWQAAIFKGHQERITDMDWSSNGKFLASCSEDRTVLLWFAKDLLDKNRRSIRVNVPFDHAVKVAWSPDCTAFLIAREEEKVVDVYRLKRKTEGAHFTVAKATTFKNVHEDSIVGLGIACTGRFFMTCSRDGNMAISDIKGSVLERMTVAGAPINYARVSRCGRYVAVCGTNCLVYEVGFSSMEAFQSVKTFGVLKGNESKVTHIDFNADSSRMVTATEKGFWRLYDATGNRVTLINMGATTHFKNMNGPPPTVALSHDGRIIAVGNKEQVEIFTVQMGSLDVTKASWIVPTDQVNSIIFSFDGKFLLTAGEKNIRVFHNICGYQATIKDLTKQIADNPSNSTLKERLKSELLASKLALKELVKGEGDNLLLSN